MARQQRLLLSLLLAGWAGAALGCGGADRTKIQEKPDPTNKSQADYNQEYKTAYDDAAPADKAKIVRRVVELEINAGDADEAKSWIRRGLDDKLNVAYTGPPAQELFDAVQKERAEAVKAEETKAATAAEARAASPKATEAVAASKEYAKATESLPNLQVSLKYEEFGELDGEPYQDFDLIVRNEGDRAVSVYAALYATDSESGKSALTPNGGLWVSMTGKESAADVTPANLKKHWRDPAPAGRLDWESKVVNGVSHRGTKLYHFVLGPHQSEDTTADLLAWKGKGGVLTGFREVHVWLLAEETGTLIRDIKTEAATQSKRK